MTTGANKDEHHLRGVDIARDISVDPWRTWAVTSGEGCPRCDNGMLDVFKGMEIGHIFKLGTKYSDSMGATVLTQDGKPVPLVMGCYGIGVERIIAAAVEQKHDSRRYYLAKITYHLLTLWLRLQILNRTSLAKPEKGFTLIFGMLVSTCC